MLSKFKTPQNMLILVAALGYFVDVYDLLLFGIVRKASLEDLGFVGQDNITNGLALHNWQMTGMMIGGILWGVLGDKKGRLSVLFGSIIMYSVANFANGFVQNLWQYELLRFIAGVGLAGELGAGITLVSESMDKEKRGYGTAIVAAVGVLGAVVAGIVGDMIPWRYSYMLGGVLGFLLLLMRIGVYESNIFKNIEASHEVKKGNFFYLFSTPKILFRYVSLIFVAVPVWYCVGILMNFCPEITSSLGMTEEIKVGKAIMFTYIGLTFGDLASGILSQYFKNRKKVMTTFLLLNGGTVALYFLYGTSSLEAFYWSALAIGFTSGYWALFMTTSSELFGTNIRATVTTTAPNFVRGAVVLLNFSFIAMGKDAHAAMITGIIAFSVSYISLIFMKETFGRDLDFVE